MTDKETEKDPGALGFGKKPSPASDPGASTWGVEFQEYRLGLLTILDRALTETEIIRVRDPRRVRIRLEAARARAYIANIAAGILRDFQLCELEERITKLETGRTREEEELLIV